MFEKGWSRPALAQYPLNRRAERQAIAASAAGTVSAARSPGRTRRAPTACSDRRRAAGTPSGEKTGGAAFSKPWPRAPQLAPGRRDAAQPPSHPFGAIPEYAVLRSEGSVLCASAAAPDRQRPGPVSQRPQLHRGFDRPYSPRPPSGRSEPPVRPARRSGDPSSSRRASREPNPERQH